MTILVIGGCHTYGHGLNGHPSFIDQFTKQLAHPDRSVSVSHYALVDLHQLTTLLAVLPLNQYDLILLQLGHYRLQHPPSFGSLLTPARKSSGEQPRAFAPLTTDDLARLRQTPILTPDTRLPVGNYLKTKLKLGILRGLTSTRKLARLNEVDHDLRALLTQLWPHRRRTVLLTPFTHLEPVSRFLRQRGRQLFLQQGGQQGFPVFDTDRVIRPSPAYFLTNDGGHLNAGSHELLGRTLYAFYKTHFGPEAGQRGAHALPHPNAKRPSRERLGRALSQTS
ncbi:MAG: SGNH/GDSL hydrolase family protein [Bacteroidetes bacterium]|nr:SGNH/GDSL hydrolase family protein [Fibrella sp.]